MYIKNKQYKSEITEFITNLKSNNPELEKKQKSGRSILWDSTVSPKQKSNNVTHNEIKQSPYVYF
jgi:hypothetical protein